jgi:hypothetical protein
VQAGDKTVTFQQISDGRFLWLRQDLPGGVDLGRVDLKRLQRELADPPPGNITPNMSAWMALGGLSKLLAGLETNFDFSDAQPTNLAGKEMLAVHGKWKTDRLAELVSSELAGAPSGEARDMLDHLPPQVPERVIVFLGRDDLLPHRVDYLCRRQQTKSNIQPRNGSSSWTVIARLELYDVDAHAVIDPLQFVYRPDATRIEDRTGALIEALNRSAKPTPERARHDR